jgi:hypothetical protein
MERPVPAAIGSNAGVLGREDQQHKLGSLPSYEYGLIPIGKHLTSSAGWLTPFNTSGQVAEMASRPTQVAGNLNPAYQAMLTAATGLNSYGQETPGGPGYPAIKEALPELTAPMPEASILHDYLNSKAAERKTRMFPHSPGQDWFTRFLVGPSYPKVTNKTALHRAHAEENGGFTTINIPKKKH